MAYKNTGSSLSKTYPKVSTLDDFKYGRNNVATSGTDITISETSVDKAVVECSANGEGYLLDSTTLRITSLTGSTSWVSWRILEYVL